MWMPMHLSPLCGQLAAPAVPHCIGWGHPSLLSPTPLLHHAGLSSSAHSSLGKLLCSARIRRGRRGGPASVPRHLPSSTRGHVTTALLWRRPGEWSGCDLSHLCGEQLWPCHWMTPLFVTVCVAGTSHSHLTWLFGLLSLPAVGVYRRPFGLP